MVSTKFADAVITANSNFKINLIKRGVPAEKIIVVNNVPDYAIFNRREYERERQTRDGHFTLIYPGSIASRYGLDVAIRALPLLVARIPGIRLLIVGRQPEAMAQLASLANELGVSSLVAFRPAVPVTQVPQLLARADVGIYTALPDAHMSIATPTKVLEYAAMGLPIVTSRLKVLEDIFTDDCVMFFEPGNVAQFSKCVLELFEHPQKQAELVRNADALFVNLHSWSNESREYLQLLNRLLYPRPGVVLRGVPGGKTPGAPV
jgi:glycosyltransferase involved in cell wall biosynthesis